ncbi:hypothetical protein Gbro_1101 [Gordonia bronchialis DSM 43247]|uniref:Uncharacterized protein n=1 Tax=Gordonia bronchialis (strain ATCC 25592 / DSM 43247 / BCRC 13721 / JCM 3198 / KCTC 3076 / NBRC 16047 / NCTC 10667) TaxID=526226 RepID=D0L4V7_GORB4|nr:hypothetical protein Gbro_1101 [Gordonia bronchialis DSM 43247]
MPSATRENDPSGHNPSGARCVPADRLSTMNAERRCAASDDEMER